MAFYILPNPDDYTDNPQKYALQLDNSYKLGYMSYMYNLKYFVRLLFSGAVGGDGDLVESVPMVTGNPTVLIGEGYLILNVELEGVGDVYACTVPDKEPHIENKPTSK